MYGKGSTEEELHGGSYEPVKQVFETLLKVG